MKIDPTVGRVVWYWPPTKPQPGVGNVHFPDQPFAATVAAVCDNGTITISYVDHDGCQFARRAVPLVQEGETIPDAGDYCAWMPYQVGQAKKHASESAGQQKTIYDQRNAVYDAHDKSYAAGFRGGYKQAEFDLDAMGLEAFQKQASADNAVHRDAELVHQRGFKEGYGAAGVDAWGHRKSRVIALKFPVGGYPFGLALEAARAGCKIYREGWNGRKAGLDQFVVYMERLQLPPFNTMDTARKVNDRTAKWIGADTPLDCQPYFAMHNSGGHWQPGWLASQADMLATDWVIEPAPAGVESEASAA